MDAMFVVLVSLDIWQAFAICVEAFDAAVGGGTASVYNPLGDVGKMEDLPAHYILVNPASNLEGKVNEKGGITQLCGFCGRCEACLSDI